MEKKYKTEPEGYMLRIISLRDFSDVKQGEKGGLIEKERNLSQEGDCWISYNARVYGDAEVSDNAMILHNAEVFGNAHVAGDARVFGYANIFDNALVFGKARVFGNAHVAGNARVFENASVSDQAHITDNARVSGNARVYDNAVVLGDAHVAGDERIGGDAEIKQTSNDNEVLFKDLCARAHYGVICSIYRIDDYGVGCRDEKLMGYFIDGLGYEFYFGESPMSIDNISKIKPYLRPMSDMTEKEKDEYNRFIFDYEYDDYWNPGKYRDAVEVYMMDELIDWLNAHYFDYRNLIERGLALPASEGMYNV